MVVGDEEVPVEEEPENRNPVKQFGNSNPRLRIFYLIFVGMMIYLIGWLAKIQLFDKSIYDERSDKQSLRRILYPGPRGDIYDRNGKLLVGSRPRFSAVVYLSDVKIRKEFRKNYYAKVREKRKTGEKVNSFELLVRARSEVLQNYLNDVNVIIKKDNQVNQKSLRRHIYQTPILPFTMIEELSPEDYALLTEQLPVNHPVQIYTDSARFYPYHSAAAHVLGYVTRTSDIPKEELPGEGLKTYNLAGKIGRAGLEKSLEKKLGGKTGSTVWIVDHAGYQYVKKKDEQADPVRGESITTTIDIDLQRVTENSIGNYVGAAVALDIETGDILTMASKPDYDLNNLTPYISTAVYKDIESRGAWLNRAIQGRYPPASTFKAITAIASMRIKKMDPAQLIQCDSSFLIGNRVFNEHGMNSFGFIDMATALQKSSNVYFYQTGLSTGVDTISGEAKRFGLGKKTGIELPAEISGVVPTPDWKQKKLYEPWVAGDTVNLSIGQGYLITTPLQMACFTASLARRETATIPTLIYDNERKYTIDHGGESIGLSNYHYDQLIEGMEMVTQPGGTARVLGIPGISVAAKTGTAQFRDRGQHLPLAWTIAFAPIENPEIAIAVMIEGTSPEDNYHGGSTAAPIVRDMMEHYFKSKNKLAYLNTPNN